MSPPIKYDWFTVIYTSLFSTGFLILFIILSLTSSSGLIDASIAGYCTIIIAILLICAHMFNVAHLMSLSQSSSFFTVIATLFNNIGPFILNLASIIFTLYLLITYRKNINEGHVSNQYIVFSKLSILLVLIQIMIFLKGMQTKKYQDERALPLIYNTGSYFIGVLNIYVVTIMNTILSLYTTDG